MANEAFVMNADALDIRLLRFRSRRDESPLALAHDLLEAERVTEALEVVHAGLLDSADNPDLLVLEGRAWFEDGDLPQAQAALLRAAKQAPTHVEAYRWLSQVLMKRGEPTKAIKVLDRALKLRPGDPGLEKARERAGRLARIAIQADSGNLPIPDEPVREPKTIPAPPSATVPAPPPGSIGYPSPVAARPAHTTEPMGSGSSASISVELDVSVEAPAPVVGPEGPEGPAKPLAGRRRRPMAKTVRVDNPRAGLGGEDLPSAEMSLDGPEASEPAAFEEPPSAVAEPPFEDESTALWSEPVAELVHRVEERERPGAARPALSEVTAGDAGPFDLLALEHDEDPGLEDETTGLKQEPSRPMRSPAMLAPTGIGPERPESEAEAPVQGEEGRSGELESPEQVQTLRDQGRYESGERSEEDWVDAQAAAPERTPVRGERTPVRGRLAAGWVAALLLAGGGYYGWTLWVEHRHAQADTLVVTAAEAVVDGDYAARAEAEAQIRRARELFPKSDKGVRTDVTLQAMRALEDGELEVSSLRSALERLKNTQRDSALSVLASGIIAFSRKDGEAATTSLEVAGEGVSDAVVLYLAARLAQRLGAPDASARIERASQADGAPAAIHFAHIEGAFLMGRERDALPWLEPARGTDAESLRVDLWQALLMARAEPDPGLSERLSELEASARQAAATDQVLWGAAHARLGAALSRNEAVREGIAAAQEAEARDPQVLAVLARVASEVGQHDAAYQAARAALAAAPGNPRYRDELVRTLLQRGDGAAVEKALQGADESARWVVVARARAALLTGDAEALGEASARLAKVEGDLELRALKVRVDLRSGKPARAALAEARRLSRTAAGLGAAQLALGEAALAAGEARAAVEALEKARATSTGDGEPLFLLAKAYRGARRADDAKQALEEALNVAPSFAPAAQMLGEMQLDSGEYAEAEKRFAALERAGGGLSASLGRVQALIGQQKLLDARDALAELSTEPQDGPRATVVATQLQLAMGHYSEAKKRIKPLLKGATRTADTLTLYGDVLFADDKVDAAAGAYKAALKLDAAHPDALIGRARAAVRAEKTRQAYDWLDAAEESLQTRLRPPGVRAKLWTARGRAHILDREYTRAREALEAASKLPGAPAETFFWYGETLARTKQPGARESYQKYLELAPEGELASRAQRALRPR